MSRGLGPWGDSYGVGCKSPLAGMVSAQMDPDTFASSGLYPWNNYMQMSAQQIDLLARQRGTTYYGMDLSSPEGRAKLEADMAESRAKAEAYGRRMKRERINYMASVRRDRQRDFMANTKAGYRAKRRVELMFWWVAGLTLFFGALVPLAIKIYGWFWGWALS